MFKFFILNSKVKAATAKIFEMEAERRGWKNETEDEEEERRGEEAEERGKRKREQNRGGTERGVEVGEMKWGRRRGERLSIKSQMMRRMKRWDRQLSLNITSSRKCNDATFWSLFILKLFTVQIKCFWLTTKKQTCCISSFFGTISPFSLYPCMFCPASVPRSVGFIHNPSSLLWTPLWTHWQNEQLNEHGVFEPEGIWLKCHSVFLIVYDVWSVLFFLQFYHHNFHL